LLAASAVDHWKKALRISALWIACCTAPRHTWAPADMTTHSSVSADAISRFCSTTTNAKPDERMPRSESMTLSVSRLHSP